MDAAGIAPARTLEAGIPRAAPDAAGFEDAAADAAPDASDRVPPGLTCRLECDCEPRGGETFMFCPQPVGRALAVERCELAGGSLVSIEDAALNAWLSARMAERSADDFWTDGTDSEVEGVWRWSDGRIFYELRSDAAQPQFSAWEEGQPNDLNGEDCMRATGGLWRDLGCDEEIAYVCES